MINNFHTKWLIGRTQITKETIYNFTLLYIQYYSVIIMISSDLILLRKMHWILVWLLIIRTKFTSVHLNCSRGNFAKITLFTNSDEL